MLHVKIIHQILKYPEVITYLLFISVSTIPLEYHSWIELDIFAVASDITQTGSVSNNMWSIKEELQEWR